MQIILRSKVDLFEFLMIKPTILMHCEELLFHIFLSRYIFSVHLFKIESEGLTCVVPKF